METANTRQLTRRLRLQLVLAGGPHWTGGVQYVRNLVRALGLLPEGERPRVCLSIDPPNRRQGYEEEFGRLPHVTIDRFGVPPARALLLRPRRWWRLVTGRARLSDDCSVVFPVKGPRPPRARGPAALYWVPDFQYKHLPEYFPQAERHARDELYARLFRQARFLVVSSQAVAADFRRFFPEYDQVQTHVVPFASVFTASEVAGDPAGTCQAAGLPERFCYVPNQFWQHKGHDVALAALALLRRHGTTVPLVCTGSPHDYRAGHYYPALLEQIRDAGLGGQVYLLGLWPREQQVALLRQAALVVQPSRFEGWSTVVEDARALGKPLVLSDLAAHREQAPPQAEYFPSGDAGRLAGVLARLWPSAQPGPAPGEALAHASSLRRAEGLARLFVHVAATAHAQSRGLEGAVA